MVRGWYAETEGLRLGQMAREAPGPVVELGTASGLSASYVLAHSPAHMVCVDQWTDEEVYREFLSLLEVNGWKDRVRAIRETTQDVAAGWTEPIGLLHIDASHAYDDVRADYYAWSPHVAPGGWLGFHDSQWRDVRRVIREDVGPRWMNRSVIRSLWTAQRG